MYDTIIAKSPSIIYKPGGVNAGLVVTTWAQVQEFIAFREGTVIVYVDDSIVSPALVPGASGLTDCEGRVELRPFKVDSTVFTVLQIEPGATLRDLYQITAVELRCNAQNATPSLDFTSASGGNLYIREFGQISNAAAATQPGIVIPNGKTTNLNLEQGNLTLNAPAVPLVQVQAGGSLDIILTNTSFLFPGYAGGAGNVILLYDQTSGNSSGAGMPPALPALAGAYRAQLLDPNAIIYKPGITSSPFGRLVGTWAEVQSFITNLQGTGIVYVDDSIVSPALVPGATGVTDCQGRVVLRPFKLDASIFTILQIEPGATLRDLFAVQAMELRCNPTNATRSLSFSAAGGGELFVEEGGMLSNAATATQPAVDAGLLLNVLNGGFLTVNAPGVPIINVALGQTLLLQCFDGISVTDGFAAGAGTVDFAYDATTAHFFATPGTPPALPGVTGAYNKIRLDDIWLTKQLDPVTMAAPNVNDVPHFDGTKWVAGPVPASSILSEQTIAASGVFAPTTVDVLVFVDTTGGAVNLTLPAPVAGVATRYTFKDSKQNFNVNALTLVPPGAVQIEGVNANFPITAQGAHVTVISDGVNYFV
jgi:hypothetical protein